MSLNKLTEITDGINSRLKIGCEEFECTGTFNVSGNTLPVVTASGDMGEIMATNGGDVFGLKLAPTQFWHNVPDTINMFNGAEYPIFNQNIFGSIYQYPYMQIELKVEYQGGDGGSFDVNLTQGTESIVTETITIPAAVSEQLLTIKFGIQPDGIGDSASISSEVITDTDTKTRCFGVPSANFELLGNTIINCIANFDNCTIITRLQSVTVKSSPIRLV